MSIYDDPRLQQSDDYPDQVRFEQRGDRVRARVVKMEAIVIKGDTVPKYWLFDLERGIERTMLASAKNLWGQLLEQKPMPGEVVNIELVDFSKNENGTAKLYDVSVERSPGGQAPPPPRPQASSPSPQPQRQEPPTQMRAPAPSPVALAEDDDEDIFGR